MRALLLLALVLVGCPDPKPVDTDTSVEAGVEAGVACGTELTCEAAEVCVQEAFEPACTPLTDSGATCPEGTTETMCGGAGQPCCCEPAPEMTYRCYAPSGCGDAPTCDCVSAACPSDKACMSVGSETSGVFQCEALPKP
jgi:hypothetical protein